MRLYEDLLATAAGGAEAAARARWLRLSGEVHARLGYGVLRVSLVSSPL